MWCRQGIRLLTTYVASRHSNAVPRMQTRRHRAGQSPLTLTRQHWYASPRKDTPPPHRQPDGPVTRNKTTAATVSAPGRARQSSQANRYHPTQPAVIRARALCPRRSSPAAAVVPPQLAMPATQGASGLLAEQAAQLVRIENQPLSMAATPSTQDRTTLTDQPRRSRRLVSKTPAYYPVQTFEWAVESCGRGAEQAGWMRVCDKPACGSSSNMRHTYRTWCAQPCAPTSSCSGSCSHQQYGSPGPARRAPVGSARAPDQAFKARGHTSSAPPCLHSAIAHRP